MKLSTDMPTTTPIPLSEELPHVRQLRNLGACHTGVAWARLRPDWATTWSECRDPSWLLFVPSKQAQHGGSEARNRLALAACACARRTLVALSGQQHDVTNRLLCATEAVANRSPDFTMARLVYLEHATRPTQRAGQPPPQLQAALMAARILLTDAGALDAFLIPTILSQAELHTYEGHYARVTAMVTTVRHYYPTPPDLGPDL